MIAINPWVEVGRRVKGGVSSANPNLPTSLKNLTFPSRSAEAPRRPAAGMVKWQRLRNHCMPLLCIVGHSLVHSFIIIGSSIILRSIILRHPAFFQFTTNIATPVMCGTRNRQGWFYLRQWQAVPSRRVARVWHFLSQLQWPRICGVSKQRL